jgi:hypothetical protein
MTINTISLKLIKIIAMICVSLVAFPIDLSASGQSLLSATIDEFYPTQNHKVYLPIVLNNYPLIEVDAPPCRWSRTPGGYVAIAYKWGSRLQTPGTSWRVAFEAATSDWTALPTKVYFYYSSNGPTIINTYYANDGYGGYAQPYCNGTVTSRYEIYGNSYYSHTTNEYHAYAGHETGHGQSIGHISNAGVIALMGFNPNPNVYYTPQPSDTNFVNQIYP